MPLLKIESISKRYGDFWALRDVSLEVEAGEFFGLLGTTGAGKSAILRMIAGFEMPNTGKITINDEDVTKQAPEKRSVGCVFQGDALIPHLTVAENVAVNLKTQKLAKDKIKQVVADTLNLVKLSDFETRRASELSGGQRQLAALGRAIAAQPRVLLFDEPFTNLDPALLEEIHAILKETVKKTHSAVVYATQNQEETFSLCDRIAVVGKSEVLQIGTPREIYNQPETVEVAKLVGRNNLIRAARLTSNKTALSEFQTIEGSHRLFVDNVEKKRLGAINQIVTLAIRPENLILTFGAAFPEDNLLKASITEINYFGATTRIVLDADGLRLEALLMRLIGLNVGDVCLVGLPPNRISVLKD